MSKCCLFFKVLLLILQLQDSSRRGGGQGGGVWWNLVSFDGTAVSAVRKSQIKGGIGWGDLATAGDEDR